jgi:tetratricopeptide (TPR) repeat protein
MSMLPKLRKRAAEYEQKRQLDKALELYIQMLDDNVHDLDDADVPLFNRVGDLLMRQGRTSDALGYYERAVDMYAERGYLNNAIALCNKILRQSPGRTSVYYKLGKISASKGFKSDARKNFLEYADRMQRGGNTDEALRVLKEFASLFPDQDDVRLILAEQLSKENRKDEALEQLQSLYEKLESEGRSAEARATVDRMKAIDPNILPRSSGTHRTQRPNDLVFLDLSEAEGRSPTVVNTPSPARPITPVIQPNVPALEGLMLTFLPSSESEHPAESPTAMSTPPAHELPAAIEMEVAAGFQATDLAAEAASLDIPSGVTERTGEFEAVPAPTPVEFDAEGDASEKSSVEDLADATDVVELETPARVEANDSLPLNAAGQSVLTGIEFADLELAEAVRLSEPRAHDLALRSDLPQLGAQAAMGTPPETESIESNEDAAEATIQFRAPSDAELAREEAALEDENTALAEALGAGAVEETPLGVSLDDAAREDPADRGMPNVPIETPKPVGASEASPLDAVQVGNADELLGAVPSFGEEDVTDGPVFPPIPGLSDELLSEAAAPLEGTTSRRPHRKLRRDRRYDGESARVADEEPDHARVQEVSDDASEERVEAPLPDGFQGLLDSDHTPPDKPNPEEPIESSGTEDSVEPSDATRSAEPSREPRLVASFGGAEGQLRSRLDLDPENWMLRRQLGEALLDVGNRDEGLYELELAMAGYELSGQLERAQEIVDEIIRVLPTSVRHHQKRVEFAVRSHDRSRLIDAYLELADTLFRTGAGDRSITVYARVLELDPNNDRGLFAMATLAPDQLEQMRGTLNQRRRWSQELDSIPEGGAFVRPPESPTTWDGSETHDDAPLDGTREASGADGESTMGSEETAASLTITEPDNRLLSSDVAEPPTHGLEGHDAAPESSPASVDSSQPGADANESTRDETEPSEWGVESVDATNVADVAQDTAGAAVALPESPPPSVGGTQSSADAEETPRVEAEPGNAVAESQDAAGDDWRERPADAEQPPVDIAARAMEAAEQEDSRSAETGAADEEDVAADAGATVDGDLGAAEGADGQAPSEPSDEVAEAEPSVLESNGDLATVLAEEAAEAPARRGAEVRHDTPILNRAPSLTPGDANGGDFLDLGEWLRTTEPTRSTRMVVDDSRPTGDEQADFDELLRRFKRGLAENVDAEDYQAHYDLGVAFKEMGLVDEAIAEFQKALRGSTNSIRSYEALGQCFVEKTQYPIATALLQRAISVQGTDEQQLVGVLYLLGFASEQMGRHEDALRYYQRVFAIDLEFRDITQRVSAMEQLAK